jgi:hypothetical protein
MLTRLHLESEGKIDDIARDLGAIKLALRGLDTHKNEGDPIAHSTKQLTQAISIESPIQRWHTSTQGGEPLWDHSAQIVDFVKAVLDDRDSRDVGKGESDVLSSLRKLAQALQEPVVPSHLFFSKARFVEAEANPSMPPLEAVVALLRWAKGLSQIKMHVLRLLTMKTRPRVAHKSSLDLKGSSPSYLYRNLPKGVFRS